MPLFGAFDEEKVKAEDLGFSDSPLNSASLARGPRRAQESTSLEALVTSLELTSEREPEPFRQELPRQYESRRLGAEEEQVPAELVKERRRRYLELNPEYFGPSLELADPLLYDRLIRRFQTSDEREKEGRQKGFSGVLESDLYRSEAKLEAVVSAGSRSTFTYSRGPSGEILAEERDDVPLTREEAYGVWKSEMERRFVRGDDDDFEYEKVDREDQYTDHVERERRIEDEYFDGEEPKWDVGQGRPLEGETGVQDF